MYYKINFERLKSTVGKNCPCTIDKSPDTLCPCKNFVETGKCICGVFQEVQDETIHNKEYKGTGEVS